ncbi:LacI family DNA-binding transcriptional regulator [Clostridium sp. BNL1100]|uniref:LacI family DNA-binding transcriptional regulator n=1 Tax=Clostridium sp. BNL1100 TaxID=755731 RepID=UPI00024A71A9|nr:LacI family DNA-binding transcriptional regulator [Clostridium sp. BNL1100]AEY67185.1 transcriptional regulator [Clostridium sp. BNL1100]
MKVTILDVAREANVSKSTVSLVLNNSKAVKLETQYKVREAIKKLNYTPNLAARELTTSRTHTLGIVFLTSNHFKKAYAFDSVAETLLYDTSNGIYTGLKNTDYALLTERFSSVSNPDALPSLIMNRRIDGVFLIGGLFTSDLIEHLRQINLPTVIIGLQYNGTDSIFSEMEQVGYLAGKELLEKHHKRILFLNGPANSSNSQKKLSGIQRAFSEYGEDPKGLYVVNSGYTGLDGYKSLKEIWESGLRPDAIFGASDGITSGAMRFLFEQKVNIPEDLSVIGYESSILSEYSPVNLTVIDAHKEKMGEEACRALLKRIEKPRSNTVWLGIPPTLSHGSSVIQR